MTDQPHGNSQRLDQLLDAMINDKLSKEQAAELDQLIINDENAATAFVRQIKMHAMIQWQFGLVKNETVESVTERAILDEVLSQALESRHVSEIEEEANLKLKADMQEQDRQKRHELQLTQKTNNKPARKNIVIPTAAVWGGVLAASLLLVWTVFHFNQQPITPEDKKIVQTPPDQIIDNQPKTFAMLKAVHDTQWKKVPTESFDLTRGALMLPGEYEITQGAVEITFDQGATTIIEAPAKFNLINRNEAQLIHGTLTANVPQEAIGFKVNVPHGEITDLGTEFGIKVDEYQATETVVFNGLIETRSINEYGLKSQPLRLKAGQGAQMLEQVIGFQSKRVDGGLYARDMDTIINRVRVAGNGFFLSRPPQSVVTDQLQDQNNIMIFQEKQNVSLKGKGFNLATPRAGQFKGRHLGTEKKIVTDITLDSYFVHFDVLKKPQGKRANAKITLIMPRPIVGTIIHAADLTKSNPLFSNDNTDYGSNTGRGLLKNDDQTTADDQIQISEDRRRITINISTSNIDQLRILIESAK